MEKAVLIDLEPTSMKMITTKLIGGAYHKKMEETVEVLRFDEDIYENNEIGIAKINECVRILNVFKTMCENYNIIKIYAVASPIFSGVINAKYMFDEIAKQTGFSFNVLSEEEEIKLLYSTILNTVEHTKGVIFYVNPQNTYVINFAKRNLISYHILPFGANSIANKFKCEDNDNPKMVIEKMVSYAKEYIKEQDISFDMFEEVNFVGGGATFLALSKLVRKITHYPLDMDNNFIFSIADFKRAFSMLEEYGFDRTKRISGISNDRLDNIIGGFAIIKAFSELKNVQSYCIATRGVPDAIISQKIVRENSCESTTNDLLEINLENIRYYFKVEDTNAEYVYQLTMELFRQMSIIHKLTRKNIKPLKIAALLYDCGKRIAFENHSKHSKEIILNANILGVSHKDIVIAGFACQCQNLENFSLNEWVKYKDIVDEEDLMVARKIGTIIALASALDCTKQSKIDEISCDLLGDIVIVKAKSNQDVTYEIAEASKMTNSFKKVFKKSYQII
ncbi:MAG: hypothetical protein PHQ62_00800 [Clostridia bacterium]|nr:hypothetical protein [Clostridia bacterium]